MDKLKENYVDDCEGITVYWEDGEIHRLDGPAITSDEETSWWIYGKLIPTNWIYDNIKDPYHITKEEQILMKLTWE